MTNWDAIGYFACGTLVGALLTSLVATQIVTAMLRKHGSDLDKFITALRPTQSQ